ncbi:hypothetical protein [Amycolatopsis sp. lyj-84]|uniref:hypothetical protein n=1 Tax=Amycolatopsis sp. lyj-84 TaxID=2789284 RepID=UPI003978AE40
MNIQWEQEIPAEDGTEAWTISTDYDDHAEEFWAEIVGSGPYTWEVGECFPGGRVLETGEATTLEQAQQQAEQAFSRAVNQ